MPLYPSFFVDSAAAAGYEIGNSLRFRGAQHLQRTMAGTGTGNDTVSYWIKLGSVTDSGIVMSRAITAGSTEVFTGHFSGQLTKRNGSSGATANTTAFHRDTSAWYHVVVTTSPTGSEIFVNGISRGTSGDATTFSAAGLLLKIGAFATIAGSQLNGYLSEIHFVDGQALDPTSFGEFNADGVWVPKAISGVTYGTNGFYLDFSDAADIGADRSGNGNDFTATGFELTTTTSSNYDWMSDSPTNNHATDNPLSSSVNHEKANLRSWWTYNSNQSSFATIGMGPNGGKLYWEVQRTNNEIQVSCGISVIKPYNSGFGGGDNVVYQQTGEIRVNNTVVHTASPAGNNVIVGLAYDGTNNTISFYNAGVFQYTATCPSLSVGSYYQPFLEFYRGDIEYNFGNRPLAYTPPAGFEPLSTAALPAVAITNPSDHFSTILDTGANILTAAQTKFSNGLWWIKDRANANQHQFVDSVRGGNLALQTPASGQETAYAAPAGNSVAWCWNVGGAPVANTDGTIPSQVSANNAAGFSIVTYTGNQVPSTVGHGLDAAPEMIIAKRRNNSSPFDVYHTGLTSASYRVQLNSSNAQSISNGSWNGTDPTDTVFSVNDDIATNRLNDQHVAYCWHSVPGYSAFGSYTGNGSSDGPFVYCGFKPAWLMIKNSNASTNWFVYDSVRDSYNVVGNFVKANTSDVEGTFANIDFLSNGFKLRDAAANNTSGQNHIFAAFAENPFGGSGISPATAR